MSIWPFYVQTEQKEGHRYGGVKNKEASETDAISGATPPYGHPTRLGLGKRPAISFFFSCGRNILVNG